MIIAGTGHRPDKLGGYSPKLYERLVKLAKAWLYYTFKGPDYKGFPLIIVSGMALGWDQALVQAAHDFSEWLPEDYSVKIIACIPFAGQECSWTHEGKRQYFRLLSLCDEIQYISPPGYESWKMQKRNEAMVDYADQIVALWNGSSGGTANCLKYAESQKKPVINLWSEWEKLK